MELENQIEFTFVAKVFDQLTYAKATQEIQDLVEKQLLLKQLMYQTHYCVRRENQGS